MPPWRSRRLGDPHLGHDAFEPDYACVVVV
jgi:hypothetical protein